MNAQERSLQQPGKVCFEPRSALVLEDYCSASYTPSYRKGQILIGRALYINGGLVNFEIRERRFGTEWYRIGRNAATVQWRLLSPLEELAMAAD